MSNDKTAELLTEIRVDIAEIKTDLRHHIKRSDAHEKLIYRLWVAVGVLAGTGLGVSGPSVANFVRSIM